MHNQSKQQGIHTSVRKYVQGALVSLIFATLTGIYYALNVCVLPDGTLHEPFAFLVASRVFFLASFVCAGLVIWKRKDQH